MQNTLRAIKKTIERYVVGKQALTSDVSAGDIIIQVASSRRYKAGDQIAIYKKPAQNEASLADIRTITEIPSTEAIIVDEPLSQDYPAETSGVEKSHYGAFMDGIYIGDPAVLPGFPAITIDLRTKTNKTLTLESTSEEYDLAITVYSDATDYESQYLLMIHYAQEIENSLWRSLYPLVEPYDSAPLSEDVVPSDTMIRLTQAMTIPPCRDSSVFLEGSDRVSMLRVRADLGNLVYELATPVGSYFSAGDTVIRPTRYFYMTFPKQLQIGTINASQGPLKAAVLNYHMREERRRFAGFHDPMTY